MRYSKTGKNTYNTLNHYSTIAGIPTAPQGVRYDYSYPIPRPLDLDNMEPTIDRAHNGRYQYIDSHIHWHRNKSSINVLNPGIELPEEIYHDKCISTLLPGDSRVIESHKRDSETSEFHKRDYKNLLEARRYQESLQDRYRHTKPTSHNTETHAGIVENPDMAKLYLYDA